MNTEKQNTNPRPPRLTITNTLLHRQPTPATSPTNTRISRTSSIFFPHVYSQPSTTLTRRPSIEEIVAARFAQPSNEELAAACLGSPPTPHPAHLVDIETLCVPSPPTPIHNTVSTQTTTSPTTGFVPPPTHPTTPTPTQANEEDDLNATLPPLVRPLPNRALAQVSHQTRIRIIHAALRIVPDLLPRVRDSYETETVNLTPIVALVIQTTVPNTHWTVFDGIAWYNGRIYVGGDRFRADIISWCHLADLISEEHLSITDTLWILQSLFYWDTLQADLQLTIRRCPCQTLPVSRVTSTQH